MRWFFVFLSLLLGLAGRASAEIQYNDDRSDAAALVRSLYNAVNRKEYARAWDYFSSAPAKDFDAYQKGYADTASVTVYTGSVSAEGAAGSVFYQVPVAIRAIDQAGKGKVFAGCYTIRAVNAQIQDPPFRALRIESAKLKPAEDGFLSTMAPEKCGDVPIEKETAEGQLARVIALYASENRTTCNRQYDNPEYGGGSAPSVNQLKYRNFPEDPEVTAILYSFDCESAAYNFTSVYYLVNPDGLAQKLFFAVPELDVVYTDDTSEKLKSIAIAGYRATDFLFNADFNPATKSLSSFSKWRGIGDASSSGTWTFKEGQFLLTDYDVDPTYDGEMDAISLIKNGQTVPQ
jgi:Protein of unknown function (DUF1176)